MLLALLLSSRSAVPDTGSGALLRDHVFPFVNRLHRPGEGTFVPGSFALNFFVPALAVMLGINAVIGERAGPLLAARANVFTYLFVLLVAIGEIGSDTVLPLLSLPGRWRFPFAVTCTHTIFFIAVALAAVVTRGADREW